MVETGGIGGTLASTARSRCSKQMEEVGVNVNGDRVTPKTIGQIELTEHYGKNGKTGWYRKHPKNRAWRTVRTVQNKSDTAETNKTNKLL